MNDSLQIKNLESIRLPNNKVLIEYFNQNEELHYGDISLKVQPHNYASSDLTSSGRGRHLERSGVAVKVCDRIKTHVRYTRKGNEQQIKWNWYTDVEITPGEKVWFPSSAFDNAPKFHYGGRNFLVTDYHRLYMSESRMLNGYLLCEKVQKPASSSVISDPTIKYYDQIYRVFRRGNPVTYIRLYQDIPEYISEGDYIMTRGDVYPKLEEEGHKMFSDKTLYIFQGKEVISKVEFEEEAV